MILALALAATVPLCPTLKQARKEWPNQPIFAVYDQRGRRCWMNQDIKFEKPEYKIPPLPVPPNWG
jgi:hypothetical protein